MRTSVTSKILPDSREAFVGLEDGQVYIGVDMDINKSGYDYDIVISPEHAEDLAVALQYYAQEVRKNSG